jgi:integrase
LNTLVTEWSWSLRAQDYSPTTVRDHTGAADRFLTWLPVPLEEATGAHAAEWLAGIDSPYVRRNSHFGIKGFVRWAAAEGLCDNFTQRLRTPKVPEPVTKVATEGEIDALLDTCTGRSFHSLRDAAIISVLASTGMRRSECSRVALDDIDPDAGSITIPKTKNGKARTVYLTPDARRRLGRYIRVRSNHPHSDLSVLWLASAGAMQSDSIRLMLERRSKRAGVKVSSHQFRRAYAYSWLKNGGSQVGLMTTAGWTDPSMPMVYLRAVSADLAREEHTRLFGTEPVRNGHRRVIARRRIA